MSDQISDKPCCDVPAQGNAERERWVRPRYRVIRGVHGAEVRVAVPGAAKNSVHVSVEEGVLTVRADRKDKVGGEWRPMQTELDRAGFLLKLELNSDFEAGAIKARVENGVLHLNVPFAEAAKARTISVS